MTLRKIFAAFLSATMLITSAAVPVLAEESAKTITGDAAVESETDDIVKTTIETDQPIRIGETGYGTLEDAIDDAEEGDKIIISSGKTIDNAGDNGEPTTYTLEKNINIEGEGDQESTLANTKFITGTKELTLKNLKITGRSNIDMSSSNNLDVEDCYIDVTLKAGQKATSQSGDQISYVASFIGSKTEGPVVNMTLKNNTILVNTDEGRNAYAVYTWNRYTKLEIIGNIFGSENDRYSFEGEDTAYEVVNIQNADTDAVYIISDNVVYGDATFADFRAFKLYQNNSRANAYTVYSSNNTFDILGMDSETDSYAFCLEVNSTNSDNVVGGPAVFDSGSTVNGEPITLDDFYDVPDNSNEKKQHARNYGIDTVYDENGKIIGGNFKKPLDQDFIGKYCQEDADIVAFENSDGSYTITDSANITKNVTLSLEGCILPAEEEASLFSLGAPTKDELDSNEYIFPIKLKAEEGTIISRYMSAELTLNAEQGEYAVRPCENASVVDLGEVKDGDMVKGHKYGLYMKGEVDGEYGTGITSLSGPEITIGYVEILGYGPYSISVVDGVIRTAEAHNNIVDSYTTDETTDMGKLLIEGSDDKVAEGNKEMEMKDLTVNVTFPNEVKGQSAAYTDMQVTISGLLLDEPIKVDLGNDKSDPADPAVTYAPAVTEGDPSYAKYSFTKQLTEGRYTITFSGGGYRTFSHDVLVNADKTITVWNNVMDETQNVIENSKDERDKFDVTFLAGDIVENNTINLYDLSAAVAYFGKNDETDMKNYVQYDLNRDKKIDSKDIAMVLVSWGK